MPAAPIRTAPASSAPPPGDPPLPSQLHRRSNSRVSPSRLSTEFEPPHPVTPRSSGNSEMRNSSQRDLTVYDFKEDDEAIESASGRFTSRLGKRGNPRAEESAVSKYTFLKAFAEVMPGQNKLITEDMRAQGLVPDCAKEGPRMEVPSPMTPDSGDEQSNCALSDKQSNGMQVSVCSEDDGSCASTPDHVDREGSLKYPATSDCWTGFREADDTDMPVIVLAEFVLYGSKSYAESRLIFCSDSFKIECLDENGKEFTSEWEIANIIHINCWWSQSVGTALVRVWLRPSVGTGVADVHDASVVVRFCVPGFQWLDKAQKIMLLAPRYKDIWSTVSDAKLDEEEDEILGPKLYISRHYLFEFKESCEEVIYPRGDPDAVSISKRDLDLLQPETFVNDTIIDFYIKYLINKIQPKEKHRFHFFNSFFFRKLVDLDKDPSSAAEGRAAFLRVRKWTRKVNIFEKDYILIPVNFNLHWSLLVICHPGEVAHSKEKSVYEAHRVPCILHMDSMKGSHSGLKDLVQSYLWEEWKERNQESPSLLNFSNLRFIPLELPQQQNSYDCGLFLLHYVELFLKEAPENFNPFTITKFSNFLTMDWFVPDEASHKRFVIHNLICDLLSDCEKDPPSSCNNWHCSSEPTQKNAEKEAVEFLATACNPAKTDLDNSASIIHDATGNKISSISSLDSDQQDEETGLFLHHVFEAKSIRRKAFCDSEKHFLLQNNSFHKIRSTMSPIEEEDEHSGQFVVTAQESSPPLTENLNTGMAATSYGLKDAGVLDTSWKVENSLQVEHHDDRDSSPNVTSCSSPNSLEYNVSKMDAEDTSLPHQTVDVSCQEHETAKQRPSPGNFGEVLDSPLSVSKEGLDTCVVEDSQEAEDTTSDSADCGVSSAYCQETAGSCPEMGLINNGDLLDEKSVQHNDENPIRMFGMQRPKRQKVMHEEGKCAQV